MAQAATVSTSTAACLDRLRQEVLAPGLCVACGACLGLCPHLLFFDGHSAWKKGEQITVDDWREQRY